MVHNMMLCIFVHSESGDGKNEIERTSFNAQFQLAFPITGRVPVN